jgi:hypothetical protein
VPGRRSPRQRTGARRAAWDLWTLRTLKTNKTRPVPFGITSRFLIFMPLRHLTSRPLPLNQKLTKHGQSPLGFTLYLIPLLSPEIKP